MKKPLLPDDIPAKMIRYRSAKEPERKVDQVGKEGMLRLRLEQDPNTKKTVALEQYSKVPLLLQRILYMEESLPSMAYMYLMSQSGGILQGDRHTIKVSLASGAMAHLTTQGATRVYKMEDNFAMQVVNFQVSDGCHLEYIPDQIIPYKNSRFFQQVNIKVHNNATAIYSEILVPGRVASGESFDYDICYLKTVARNQDDDLRFIDTCMLEPKRHSLKKPGILGSFDVVGNMYILAKQTMISELEKGINSKLQNNPRVSAGATILPNNSGIVVRMLGHVANDLKDIIHDLLNISRGVLLNTSFSKIRKG